MELVSNMRAIQSAEEGVENIEKVDVPIFIRLVHCCFFGNGDFRFVWVPIGIFVITLVLKISVFEEMEYILVAVTPSTFAFAMALYQGFQCCRQHFISNILVSTTRVQLVKRSRRYTHYLRILNILYMVSFTAP